MNLKKNIAFAALVLLGITAFVNDALETTEATHLQQIYLLKQIKPDVSKIAVFCQLHNHNDLQKNLQRLQKQFQVEFFLYDVQSLPDVAKFMKDATTEKNAQAFWIFADELMKNKRTIDYVVKQSVNSKIFLLSADPEVVEKGGTACVRIADGKTILYLNQKSMEMMAVEIPPAMHESAEIIFF